MLVIIFLPPSLNNFFILHLYLTRGRTLQYFYLLKKHKQMLLTKKKRSGKHWCFLEIVQYSASLSVAFYCKLMLALKKFSYQLCFRQQDQASGRYKTSCQQLLQFSLYLLLYIDTNLAKKKSHINRWQLIGYQHFFICAVPLASTY